MVEIALTARSTLNLALAHAGVPLVHAVRVTNRGSERVEGAKLTPHPSPISACRSRAR